MPAACLRLALPWLRLRAAAVFLLAVCLSPLASAGPVVSVTFDDLPVAMAPADDAPYLERMTARLLQALRDRQVPAVGFVNEEKLYRYGELDPARVDLLRAWLAAGFELGNHTYSHLSLNRVPPDVFLADLLRGETVTRPLAQQFGRRLRWFRYPFLHLGTTAQARRTVEAFLAAHRYAVAPVTVNSSEWVFAAAYARAQAQGDEGAVRRIATAYVPYMESALTRAEALSLDLFGRPIAQVLLLHANSLNADRFDELAAMLTRRGYGFVTLDEALRDPAYATPVGLEGVEGESWLECWARQAGLRLAPPVAVPAFVRQLAGSAAYRGY